MALRPPSTVTSDSAHLSKCDWPLGGVRLKQEERKEERRTWTDKQWHNFEKRPPAQSCAKNGRSANVHSYIVAPKRTCMRTDAPSSKVAHLPHNPCKQSGSGRGVKGEAHARLRSSAGRCLRPAPDEVYRIPPAAGADGHRRIPHSERAHSNCSGAIWAVAKMRVPDMFQGLTRLLEGGVNAGVSWK